MLEHLNTTEIQPKRVVVIGAGGFVGSTLVNNLQRHKINVLGLTRQQVDLLAANGEHSLAECLQPGDALVVISAKAPCKTIVMLMENLRMMEVVCNVISKAQLAQVIYISSDAVYADHVTLATENSNAQPSSMHGMMHSVRELMLRSSVPNTTPLAILRPSLLYGVADPHNGYGPNKFRRLAATGEDISLFGNGEEQRDHIYIDDVAEIIRLTLLHRSKGTLNIATGVSTSFRDIAEQVIAIAGSKTKIVPTERKNPITHRHFDITACHKAFPKFHYTKLAEGLAK